MVINNINGFLFSSEEQLVDKLKYIIKNKNLIKKWGQESFNIFTREYSLSNCLNKINDAYLELRK